MQVEPFRIEIPESALDDLRARLLRGRPAPDFANDDWSYGTPGAYLGELVDHWREGYDWRRHEAAMNVYAHFRTRIDGIPLHFIHEEGKGPDPIPLILTHGWPWTFWDYEKLIRPLADPAAHGGDPADAFHIVVPSLPGFGFSGPLETPGVHYGRVAELWVALMRDVLGYDRFAAQGGDWGGIVTAELGHRFAQHLHGIHVTLAGHPCFLAQRRPDDYGAGEEDWPAREAAMRPKITSHMAVHSADPQTLGHALNDSPLGLASWIVERRRAWSDCDGDVERRFTKDDLLTTLSLYWFTQSIGTSMRFYKESLGPWWRPAHDRSPAIEAPTGVALFVNEVMLLPRKTAARASNLVHWSVFEQGGHFAPAEEPALLVDDIRSCFRNLR
jgi:pimeloyl-ACP methyl ester carboxylesterase